MTAIGNSSIFAPVTMKKHLIHILKLFLPLIFIAYLGGITLFTHSHVVNGVIIVHSHPFKGEHQHTEVELETIFFLSSFAASGSLFTPSSTTVFWALLCLLAVPAVERIKLIRTGCGMYLRAPPAVCLIVYFYVGGVIFRYIICLRIHSSDRYPFIY